MTLTRRSVGCRELYAYSGTDPGDRNRRAHRQERGFASSTESLWPLNANSNLTSSDRIGREPTCAT